MKKWLLIVGFLAASAVLHGEDDVDAYQCLYWCVTDRGSYQFAGACLYAVNGEGDKTLIKYEAVPGNPDESGNWMASTATFLGGSTPGPTGDALVANISGYGAATSFYIELLNDVVLGDTTFHNTPVQVLTAPVTYESLLALGAIEGFTDGSMSTVKHAANSVWSPTSYVIPEPTSGLLLLMGGAFLALRRRRDPMARGHRA